MPNKQSAVYIQEYPDPAKLAEFLLELNDDSSYYEEFLDHKLKKEIRNTFLLEQLKSRQWKSSTNERSENYVNSYECYLCQKLNDQRRLVSSGIAESPKYANNDHYRCPLPTNPRTKRINLDNPWSTVFYQARLESDILTDNIVSGGRNISPMLLNKLTLSRARYELRKLRKASKRSLRRQRYHRKRALVPEKYRKNGG